MKSAANSAKTPRQTPDSAPGAAADGQAPRVFRVENRPEPGTFASCTLTQQIPPEPAAASAQHAPLPYVCSPARAQADRELQLERYLAEPFPKATMFRVLDKIAQITRQPARPPILQEIVAQAAEPASARQAARAVLEQALLLGFVTMSSRDGEAAFELATGGQRFVREGKAKRLGLWKLRWKLTAKRVCALAEAEDRKPSWESGLIRVRPAAETVIAPRACSKASQPKHQPGAMWAALVRADAADSTLQA